MEKTSVIVVARNEKLLKKTVDNLRQNAQGELEIILVLDGPTTFEVPTEVKVITKSRPEGIRKGIDDAVSVATGKYLLKTDAHCSFAPGFDKVLQEDHQDNWLVIPRRYILNPETMQPDMTINSRVRIADYFYLSCPWTNNRVKMLMVTCAWYSRTRQKKEVLIDETMGLQGSIWFCNTDYYRKTLGSIRRGDDIWGEHLHIPLQVWFSGGQVMVNKKTWYTHLDSARANNNRGYDFKNSNMPQDTARESIYWVTNQYPKRIHDFDWLVEKFWPLPTEDTNVSGEQWVWPNDWRKYYGH